MTRTLTIWYQTSLFLLTKVWLFQMLQKTQTPFQNSDMDRFGRWHTLLLTLSLWLPPYLWNYPFICRLTHEIIPLYATLLMKLSFYLSPYLLNYICGCHLILLKLSLHLPPYFWNYPFICHLILSSLQLWKWPPTSEDGPFRGLLDPVYTRHDGWAAAS